MESTEAPRGFVQAQGRLGFHCLGVKSVRGSWVQSFFGSRFHRIEGGEDQDGDRGDDDGVGDDDGKGHDGDADDEGGNNDDGGEDGDDDEDHDGNDYGDVGRCFG